MTVMLACAFISYGMNCTDAAFKCYTVYTPLYIMIMIPVHLIFLILAGLLIMCMGWMIFWFGVLCCSECCGNPTQPKQPHDEPKQPAGVHNISQQEGVYSSTAYQMSQQEGVPNV